MFKRGDLVRTWFDTGAMGSTILYGRVIAAGPKAYRVRWESGLTNRITQGDGAIKRVEPREEEAAAEAMKRADREAQRVK